jgi:hypothetical protein
MTAQSGMSLSEVQRDPEFGGRLVESAVGTHVPTPRLQAIARSSTGAIATTTWTSFCGLARRSRLSR